MNKVRSQCTPAWFSLVPGATDGVAFHAGGTPCASCLPPPLPPPAHRSVSACPVACASSDCRVPSRPRIPAGLPRQASWCGPLACTSAARLLFCVQAFTHRSALTRFLPLLCRAPQFPARPALHVRVCLCLCLCLCLCPCVCVSLSLSQSRPPSAYLCRLAWHHLIGVRPLLSTRDAIFAEYTKQLEAAQTQHQFRIHQVWAQAHWQRWN